jgi:hypothetical protein
MKQIERRSFSRQFFTKKLPTGVKGSDQSLGSILMEGRSLASEISVFIKAGRDDKFLGKGFAHP